MRLYEEIQQFIIVLDWKMLIILSLQQWKADLPDLFYSFENYYEGYLLFSQHQEYLTSKGNYELTFLFKIILNLSIVNAQASQAHVSRKSKQLTHHFVL